MMQEASTSKAILKTADRYMRRIRSGDRIVRDADGALYWASGKVVGKKTVLFMLSEGMIAELDTDLFGDPRRGQTLGIPNV